MTQTKQEISIPLKLTNKTTVHFKPFGVATIFSVGIVLLSLFYTVLLNGWLSDLIEHSFKVYSTERSNLIYYLLLIPSSILIAYSIALLTKERNKALFWVYVFFGTFFMMVFSAGLGFVLNY